VVTVARRLGLALSLPIVMAALAAPRPAAAQDDVPAIVHKAVATYAAEHHGTVAFSRHLAFLLHLGPVSRQDRNEIGIMMRDGAMLRTKYYSSQTNGKTDDDAKRNARTTTSRPAAATSTAPLTRATSKTTASRRRRATDATATSRRSSLRASSATPSTAMER
jgi:hypothetical protein